MENSLVLTRYKYREATKNYLVAENKNTEVGQEFYNLIGQHGFDHTIDKDGTIIFSNVFKCNGKRGSFIIYIIFSNTYRELIDIKFRCFSRKKIPSEIQDMMIHKTVAFISDMGKQGFIKGPIKSHIGSPIGVFKDIEQSCFEIKRGKNKKLDKFVSELKELDILKNY